MYKYIRYFIIAFIFQPLRKVLGLVWFYLAIPFRGYARNVVQNYVLQKELHLPRLYERCPILVNGDKGKGYYLKDIHNVSLRNTKKIEGFIKYRKIKRLEYQLAFWLIWGWLDDDSNHDTMSGKYREGMVYGNTFDLGDTRAEYPQFDFKESTAWLHRNTAYNFKYMLHECKPSNSNWFYKRITTRYFDWHFGFLPENHDKEGRLVYFKEYMEGE